MSNFFKINDRVRHKNMDIDRIQGIMIILNIKGEYATCANLDPNKHDSMPGTYSLQDLKLAEN
jgi:hypothetical protein